MKKGKVKYIIIGIVSLVLIFLCCFIFPEVVYVPDCEKGEITCVEYNENNQEIRRTKTMSEEDTEIIKEIFSKKQKLYFDSPSCGFYGHSIRLCNEEFYPACDTCNIILYKTKYFHVSEEEIEEIHKIMEKYGAKFPCV